MKALATVCVAALLVPAFTSATNVAFAADGFKARYSSVNLTDEAAKACAARGGVVATDSKGDTLCITPVACSAPAAGVAKDEMTSTPINANDSAAVIACFDACGTLSKGADGKQICIKPNIAPAREPNNSR